jgi:hypothetical protein
MAIDKQKLLPIGGMNMDSDESVLPETQATFIKNHINAINNIEDGNSGGQSTNALTPYPSISTNFDDADLPRLRSYSIDLSAITYPAHIISSVKDTTETVAITALPNLLALTTYMTGLGFTNTGGAIYTITNTTYIWQKIIFRNTGAAEDYYRSVLFTETAVGALNGSNTCIGAKYDLKLNQMVWFNYNSNNRHNIQLYNATTDTYTTVLETPLFNFSISYRISSINIVIADVDSNEGIQTVDRLLYWTDGNVAPRKINIDRAIDDEYWNHSNYINYRTDDEFMCLVKYPPQTRIEGVLGNDSTTNVDYVDSNSYQFRQNFIYDDGEQSTWSDISSLTIARTNDGSTFFVNQVIELEKIDAGSSIVNKINIAYRIGNFGDWRQTITLDRETAFADATINQFIFTYTPLTLFAEFKNDNAYKIIDQVTANNLFDVVPYKSYAQELLSNNVLSLGNNLSGWDNLPQEEINKCTVVITYPSNFNTATPQDNQVLKGGGIYQFGIIEYDDANRSSAVNTTPALQKYINTVMENGGYYLQNITVNLNGLVFSDGAKKFAICRTQNTVINRTLEKGFIQWCVSSVLYVDNANQITGAAPSAATQKVIIAVSGLDQFNTDNFNQTSTSYQFSEGDKITLITAGGNVIDPTVYGIITKELRSTDGFTLIFDMDDRIDQLDTAGDIFFKGDIIEIWSPSSESTNLFYEITEQLEIDQTTHTYTPDAVTLDTWDTYFLVRDDYPLADPYDAANQFHETFEHHSFSDTIADSQGEDIGRVNMVNENARQQWKPAEVRYSYPYVQNTFINGLSTFDSGRKKDYYRQYGGITRMYCEQYNLAIIQEEKAFRSMVNRNLLTSATGDNTITISSDILSDAIEIQGNFGCQNGETFIGRQGMLYWVDLKRGAFVGGNFDRVEDISALYDKNGNAQGIKTYALKALKNIFNTNNDRELDDVLIHAGFDPKLNQWVFTSFNTDPNLKTFTNNFDNWSILRNETVAFNTAGKWDGFFSFTPEFFGICEGKRNGNCLVSFKEGIPYFHNQNDTTTYLNFYGTECDKYFEIVSNKGDGVKNAMNISIDSKSKSLVLAGTKYSAVSVKTSNNQLSTIPLPSFVQKEGMWWSQFYRNTNLGKTIITGDPLKFSWIKVKLKGDTTKNSEYNEVRGVTVLFNDSKYTV